MQYLPECIIALASAISKIAAAWAITMCCCNIIKMLCVTWLADNRIITADKIQAMMKIEPIWDLKNTKNATSATNIRFK